MNKTLFTVFWLNKEGTPHANQYTDMADALAFMEFLRRMAQSAGYTAITMCSENIYQVGMMGATGVTDSKLPNGDDYAYTKHDALSQRNKKIQSTKVFGTDSIDFPLDEE